MSDPARKTVIDCLGLIEATARSVRATVESGRSWSASDAWFAVRAIREHIERMERVLRATALDDD